MTQNYDLSNIQAHRQVLLRRSQNCQYDLTKMKDVPQVVEALNVAKALQGELRSRYSRGEDFGNTEDKISYLTKKLEKINEYLGNSGSTPIHPRIFQKEISFSGEDIKLNPDSLNLAIRVIETYHTIESQKQKLREGPRLEDIL